MLIFGIKFINCNLRSYFISKSQSVKLLTLSSQRKLNTFSVNTTIQVNSFHAAFLLHNNRYWKDKRGGRIRGGGCLRSFYKQSWVKKWAQEKQFLNIQGRGELWKDGTMDAVADSSNASSRWERKYTPGMSSGSSLGQRHAGGEGDAEPIP